MSYLDERLAKLDHLAVEFEKEFNSFSKTLRRMLVQFISQGTVSHTETIAFFATTGYLDVASSVVAKYEDVLEITKDLVDELGMKFVLPSSGIEMLNIFQENNHHLD